MTGVTISWNLQVVQDSERTPETPAKHAAAVPPAPESPTPQRPAPEPSSPQRPAPEPPSPRPCAPPSAPASTYFGTPRTTREVPRNSATTLSSQYKVTSVIPLRP